MIEAPALLRSYVQGIRRLSGADCASLFIPAPMSRLARPLLLHDGDAPPVPELEDLESAEEFANRMAQASAATGDQESSGIPSMVVSQADDSGLVPLPSVEPPWTLGALFGEEGNRRRTDALDSRSGIPLGAWIGLRFSAGKGTVLERLASSYLPSSLRQARDPEHWWDWLFALGGALASHTSQVSAILKDPTTGLPDRKEFQAVLADRFREADDEGTPLSLLLINPDDFYTVNERFGRESGDQCVRTISEALRTTLRVTDLVSRYGGVVFAAILSETPEQEAREIAERVEQYLGGLSFLDGEVSLSFSIGLATFQPGKDPVSVPLELIRRADLALNTAKRMGGGTVVGWQEDFASQHIGSFDRLSGIFTGNMAKDYRNMVLLRDTIDIIALHDAFDDLAARVVDRLYTAFSPSRIGLFTRDEQGHLQLLRGLTRSDGGGSLQAHIETLELEPEERQRLRIAVAELEASEFVYDPSISDSEPSDSKQRAFFTVPLTVGSDCLGCLMIDGQRGSMTLDSSDLIFLKALSAQLAVAMDRARLADLERRRQEKEHRALRAELSDLRQALQQVKLVYRSSEMESVVGTARRVAPTDATVLITGASGTGKELLAHTIHQLSPRRNAQLVVVDCGAIAATLIESELFGHEKGAYTGAQQSRAGRLMQANGGTVLLDEIGELPLEVQTKLLRFVQEKQFTTVGGTKARRVDVRIIAATNRDLATEVQAGRFREDLYHRLNVLHLRIPPLRERPDDILHLARHFLELYAVQYQKQARSLSPAAEEAMLAHTWPGNVRELQNRLLQSVILSDNEELEPDELGLTGESLDSGEVPTLERQLEASVESSDVETEATTGTEEKRIDPWAELRKSLQRQIELAAESDPPLGLPLGRWLADDLILEAGAAAGQVARRGCQFVGLPESTFRRRLKKASQQIQSGLAPRSGSWNEVQTVLAELVHSPAREQGRLLEQTQEILLEEIVSRFPDDVRTGSLLLGVSPPTYRRRLRDRVPPQASTPEVAPPPSEP
jgi:diguanylate cyclase (GGDEF)-like protein